MLPVLYLQRGRIHRINSIVNRFLNEILLYQTYHVIRSGKSTVYPFLLTCLHIKFRLIYLLVRRCGVKYITVSYWGLPPSEQNWTDVSPNLWVTCKRLMFTFVMSGALQHSRAPLKISKPVNWRKGEYGWPTWPLSK